MIIFLNFVYLLWPWTHVTSYVSPFVKCFLNSLQILLAIVLAGWNAAAHQQQQHSEGSTEVLSASALLVAVLLYSPRLQQHAHAAHQKRRSRAVTSQRAREKGRKKNWKVHENINLEENDAEIGSEAMGEIEACFSFLMQKIVLASSMFFAILFQ